MGDADGRTTGSRIKRGLQIAAACVVVFVGAYAVGTAVAGPFFWDSCSLNGLEAHGPAHASVLLASDGTRLGMLGASGSRLPVPLQKIDPVMRKAIIDTEDRRFYDNNGIDYIGILRALRADVSSGQFAQGASTIEQQLVRNLYLSPQQTLGRKIEEGCLAVQLDRQWSKDRILTAYLNDIYFGREAYGIEAAATTYFGVHAKDLSLDQAALLAGLPQAPSAYDPIARPGAARARRAEVLQAMLQAGDISESRYRKAVDRPLGLHPTQLPGLGGQTYLSDFITSQLVDQYGAERIRRGGLRIYTTLDSKAQAHATQAILATLDRKNDPAGSIVSIDPATGQIRAMAVAQHATKIAYDIPADAQRQAGSTFKMFTLTEAVQRRIDPWTTKYLSAPFVGPDNWHVHTYENTYSGRIPISQATLLSDNTVFARLTLDVGPKPVADLAQRMGIQSQLKPVPSIVLGVNAISPLDLASAYATLADGGVMHQPTILTKVAFPGGNTEGASEPRGKRVVDAKVAAAVTRILEANVRSGTGTAAALARARRRHATRRRASPRRRRLRQLHLRRRRRRRLLRRPRPRRLQPRPPRRRPRLRHHHRPPPRPGRRRPRPDDYTRGARRAPGLPWALTGNYAAFFLPSIFDHHSSSSTSAAEILGPLGQRGIETRRCLVSSSSTVARSVCSRSCCAATSRASSSRSASRRRMSYSTSSSPSAGVTRSSIVLDMRRSSPLSTSDAAGVVAAIVVTRGVSPDPSNKRFRGLGDLPEQSSSAPRRPIHAT